MGLPKDPTNVQKEEKKTEKMSAQNGYQRFGASRGIKTIHIHCQSSFKSAMVVAATLSRDI